MGIKKTADRKFSEGYAQIIESRRFEGLKEKLAEEEFISKGFDSVLYTTFILAAISLLIMQVRLGEEKNKIRVQKVREDNMLRESLVLALKKECPDFDFLQASTGEEAKKILTNSADCHMILLDLQVGKENGFSILSEIRKIRPEITCLVCSAFYEPLTVKNAINAKVQGYITKTSGLNEIAFAVKKFSRGEEYFCTEALSIMKADVNASKIASSGK
ncbi:MAG: response regulator transcription factor [Treponema sp.]|nr:response regulator transcription factor [Treponema sp.]